MWFFDVICEIQKDLREMSKGLDSCPLDDFFVAMKDKTNSRLASHVRKYIRLTSSTEKENHASRKRAEGWEVKAKRIFGGGEAKFVR
jgi:hypothetical protein